MGNMDLWDAVKTVPADAKRPITGGRLRGKTDITPQWRLKVLTEQFGPIGIGWNYETVERWTEEYTDQVSVHVRIRLTVKIDGEWSGPIEGQGGSMLVEKEKAGPYHSDEAYKMATTDAISVACKQLGIAADVYMGYSDSKQSRPRGDQPDYSKQIADLKSCDTIEVLMDTWRNVWKALGNDQAGKEILTGTYNECKARLS